MATKRPAKAAPKKRAAKARPARPRKPKAQVKTGRETLLTPEVQAKIVAYIRSGAYDWVAAQAVGIGPSTFYEWMARGESRHPDRPSTPELEAFAAAVRQARAQVRATVELEIRRDEPFKWLRYGPGRERPGEPGWTDTSQVELSGPAGGPIQTKVETAAEPSDEDIAETLHILMEKGLLEPEEGGSGGEGEDADQEA